MLKKGYRICHLGDPRRRVAAVSDIVESIDNQRRVRPATLVVGLGSKGRVLTRLCGT